jgi:hypothetical protein
VSKREGRHATARSTRQRVLTAFALTAIACGGGSGSSAGSGGTGAGAGGSGASGTGGGSSGAGGSGTGGSATGGTSGSGTGGSATGGTSGSGAGGSATGGTSGSGTGGSATGGTSGSSAGGSATGGSGGTCSGGETSCAGACVDLTSDPNNCGACGRGCQGGTCNASQCSVVTLVTGQADPHRIAVDSSALYWIDTGEGTESTGAAVMKIALSGGTATPLFSPPSGRSFNGIALDATRVFVTSPAIVVVGTADVDSIPKAGGSPTVLYGASGAGFDPGDIASNAPTGTATTLFFVDYDSKAVDSVSASGGTRTSLGTFTNLTDTVYDGTALYVGYDGTISGSTYVGGGVTSINPTTDQKTTVGSGTPLLMTTDATNVYFANVGTVTALPKAGGPETTLATAVGPYAVAVDATDVYFTVRGAGFTPNVGWGNCAGLGSVHKVPKGGGTDTTLATGLNCPGPIAVDATTIYFAELGSAPTSVADGTIKKLAK